MRTRSPFPGMDPWLESDWGDMHHRCISSFADQIQEQLPPDLFAGIELTVYIADDDGEQQVIPDVGVFDSGSGWANSSRSESDSNLAVATPYRIQLNREPVEEGHVVIRSLKNHKAIVTVIEVLSPTNKVDRRGRTAYIKKREEYYRAHANLVEVDLLRVGAELIDVPFEEIPDRLLTPYKAVVRRSYLKDNTEAEYYAFPMRERLPRIRIPLRRKDSDVVLDIQMAIDEAYKKGRFATRIDYSKPPVPPLSPEDTAWSAELVAASV